jgi:hypothetical protein
MLGVKSEFTPRMSPANPPGDQGSATGAQALAGQPLAAGGHLGRVLTPPATGPPAGRGAGNGARVIIPSPFPWVPSAAYIYTAREDRPGPICGSHLHKYNARARGATTPKTPKSPTGGSTGDPGGSFKITNPPGAILIVLYFLGAREGDKGDKNARAGKLRTCTACARARPRGGVRSPACTCAHVGFDPPIPPRAGNCRRLTKIGVGV